MEDHERRINKLIDDNEGLQAQLAQAEMEASNRQRRIAELEADLERTKSALEQCDKQFIDLVTDDERKFRQQLVCAALTGVVANHILADECIVGELANAYAEETFDEYQSRAKERAKE